MAKHSKRLIALILAIVMVLGLAIPAGAATNSDTVALPYTESTANPDLRLPKEDDKDAAAAETPDDDEIFRVSIILEDDSTLDKGYSTDNIANNKSAIAYRNSLEVKQEKVETIIEKNVLGGKDLDVVWNLTLAANLISANVEYGQIEAIKAIKGVKDVVIEMQYAPAVTDDNLPVDPQMSTSSVQIGSGTAWADGYTGAGSTVAVIDTGIDLDHKSFDADAFDYAIAKVIESGKEVDLLDVSDIEKVFNQLNIVKLGAYSGNASGLWQSTKIPFAFNYVDGDLDVTHDNDGQGEHGSHVTGIAAANRYIKDGDDYVNALTSVLTQGVAPDAQIITMKVFGKGGGAYDSDYMAAIEDAIVLGADTVNLSLGSAMAGFSRSDAYEDILNKLVESNTVVTISAGNSGYWSEEANLPYLYGDDVNFSTTGSPGSYTNSLGVASVDNVGSTGDYVAVGDDMIFYTETFGPKNDPLASLAGEQEYVIIDGIGSDEEFAAVEDILDGKIAICYRGEISFYVKAENAVAHGAIATIIINNQAGTISMDLTDYTKTQPAVSVTYADGELFWDNADYEGDQNDIWYATGTMTVGSDVASSNAEKNEDGIYTMSSFSSWGVPGSLTMKPEITAPGGNIYSVNGAIAGGEAYENMSGTSMAAPQVSGMAAVIAQYIRENAEKFADVELTTRGLINSLLMATAEPIIEEDADSYYSILTQGAGLANVGNAISADAYIVMGDNATASAADGKVKVELGDDPAKEGVYTYDFTINNTSGTENVYTLDTALFTQDLFTDSGYLLLDTWTTPISADVTYTVNGAPFDTEARIDADVNQDGYTNAADAQAILDFLVGNIPEDELDQYKFEVGDLDEDENITTYDAHLILKGIEATLTVPANGSVEVEVTITITEDLSAYENGAYIEGFTFVEPVASEEGELDVTYSIPVLGFYGNWSDPSMFDRLDLEGLFYGSDHDIPYTGEITNELDFKDGDNRETYALFGNPYVEGGDEEYHPEREALRGKDTLSAYYYTLIRNAGARLAVIYDSKGNVVYSSPISSEYAAFYYTSGGSWQYTYSTVNLGVKVGTLNTPENEQFTFEMYAIPEYYLTDEMYEDGEITLDEVLSIADQLGNGAVVTKQITVDNTAPDFTSKPTKSNETGDLTITVKDNQYIAYAAVLNRSGTVMFAEITADEMNQTKAGQEIQMVFSGEDLADAGEFVAVAVCDYAGNMGIFEVQYGEHVDREGKMYGFTSGLYANGNGDAMNTWLGLDPETVNITATAGEGYAFEDATRFAVASAEYIDGYIFQSDADGNLYVAPEADFGMTTLIGNMGVVPIDMAYDYSRNALYALVTLSTANVENKNAVYKINPLTGKATLAFYANAENNNMLGKTFVTLYGMAIDDDGIFYFNSADLFKVENWNGTDVSVTPEKIGSSSGGGIFPGPGGGGGLPSTGRTMAWDHNTKTLYLVSTSTVGNANNFLAIIDTATGKYTRANGTTAGSLLYAPFTALFIAPGLKSGEDFTPTEKVDSITINLTEMSVMVGASYQLTAKLTPWTLTDTSVTWKSSDEKVAVVDELGYVTAVGVGSATITAASVADPTKIATSEIEVLPLPAYDLYGLIYDTDSVAYWSSFNTQNPAGFKHLAKGSYLYAGALDMNGDTIYANDGESIYAVDANTFATSYMYDLNPTYLFPDAAFNFAFGSLSNETDTLFVSPMANSRKIALLDPVAGDVYGPIDYSKDFAANIAAITWAGLGQEDGYGYLDAYYILLENGDLWQFLLTEEGYTGKGYLGNTGLDLSGAGKPDGGSSASMAYDWDNSDGYTEYLYVSHYADDDDGAYLSVIEINYDESFDVESCDAKASVSFGNNVWPVVALIDPADISDGTNAVVADKFADVELTQTISTSDVKSAVAVDETEAATVDTDDQTPVTGGLNAVSLLPGDSVDHPDKAKDKAIIDTDANTVTIKVYADDSTNALLSVNYDAEIFTLESVTGLTEYHAYNADTAGTVAFDYAAAGALTKKVAEIVLSYDEEDEKNIVTDIVVNVKEESDHLGLNEKDTIPIDLTEDEPQTPSTPTTPSAPDKNNGNPNSPMTGAEAGFLAVFMLILFIGCGVLSVYPVKRRREGMQK